MLQATVHGRSLDYSPLMQSFRIKLINVRPSNNQTVASEHLSETIITVTIVTQKLISASIIMHHGRVVDVDKGALVQFTWR